MLKSSLVFLIISLLSATVVGDNCEENSNKECEPTEYVEYVKCMRERTKREINCQNQQDYDDNMCDCDVYNCKSCYTCNNSCDTCCSQCCNTINSCKTNHCCHNYCHTSCRDSSCRNSCKKTCREQIIQNDNETTKFIQTTNHTNTIIRESNNQHNITTIINLKNFINNTNLINVPIIVNNTNFHNITLEHNKEINTIYDRINQTNATCCLVIGPRQCVQQEKFPFIRCFHIRKKQCGPICLSPILHYHQYEFCDNTNQSNNEFCQRQTIYIPQPRPRCAHQPFWPYVSCNGNRYESCQGCYDHYMNPYERNQCSSYCYDDGYGTGPYYRQGPFYRPGYAHTPSCYQTGYCNMIDNNYYYNNGPYLPSYQPNYGGFYPNFGSFNNFPIWNLGYPQQTYDAPFIVDNIDGNSNDSVNHSYNRQEPFVDFFINNPQYPLDDGVNYYSRPPKDVSIEAEILSPRSTRYAEIKIQAENNANDQIATTSGLQVKEDDEHIHDEDNEENKKSDEEQKE